jgi:ribosomal protein S17
MKLKEEAKRHVLVVNEGKTKHTKYGRRKTKENKLEIETMEYNHVECLSREMLRKYINGSK